MISYTAYNLKCTILAPWLHDQVVLDFFALNLMELYKLHKKLLVRICKKQD